MKKALFFVFTFLFLSSFSFVDATNYKVANSGVVNDDNYEKDLKNNKNIDSSQNNEEKVEQKSETEKKEEEKSSLLKDMNSLLVNGYKSKFIAILDALEEKIKNKEKEEKIKIFSNILFSVNSKLELIYSKKVSLSENRKTVLKDILEFIKEYTQDKIKGFAKEK